MVRLLEDSGFGFLPEGDLLNQPTMDVVMTVGLRLCALEFSSATEAAGLHVLVGCAPGKLPICPMGISRFQIFQYAGGCHLYMCS